MAAILGLTSLSRLQLRTAVPLPELGGLTALQQLAVLQLHQWNSVGVPLEPPNPSMLPGLRSYSIHNKRGPVVVSICSGCATSVALMVPYDHTPASVIASLPCDFVLDAAVQVGGAALTSAALGPKRFEMNIPWQKRNLEIAELPETVQLATDALLDRDELALELRDTWVGRLEGVPVHTLLAAALPPRARLRHLTLPLFDRWAARQGSGPAVCRLRCDCWRACVLRCCWALLCTA
jgi:hypothetical protein